jgi:hypothetical protein
MHSGMSLFSGRQPLDTAVMARKAEALGCDALWRGEHAILSVHGFPPTPGSSGGSIPDLKVFHSCGSRSSMATSNAAQSRKSMRAVTASQPMNKSTTLKPPHIGGEGGILPDFWAAGFTRRLKVHGLASRILTMGYASNFSGKN